VADRNYRLIVEGQLSDRMTVAVEGMALTRSESNTALTGNVRDQAELQGVIGRVSDLRLAVLEVRALDDRLQELRGRGTDQETRRQLGSITCFPFPRGQEPTAPTGVCSIPTSWKQPGEPFVSRARDDDGG
jgi:hypothetical protein